MKNIALLCNPTPESAGKVLPMADRIINHLKRKDVSFTVFNTQWPIAYNDFTELWIVGGDGTLNYFLNHFTENELPLAVFPGGSGNDYHWALYGDIEVEDQIEKVLKGQIKRVDAGLCNGLWFINGVGIGFDGAIIHDMIGKSKLAGKASYLLSVLKNIVSYTEKSSVIVMDSAIVSQECMMISVANGNRYGGGFYVTPQAVIDDGLLDINILGRIAPLRRIKYMPILERGEHLDLPFVQYHTSKKVSISSQHVLHAHLDGEYLASNTFEIEILPNRIAFVV
ncbi:MAG TPA: YegS/Rv2252/BmrU family lipid kinase [Flavisolibacter sp.]|nr:YegS/Rv2252/BmrU family lipid kinase [Flavisolibacter sp.]